MMTEAWFSLGLGGGLGAFYGAVSYVTYRMALRAPGQRFLQILLASLLLRMFTALVVIALVMTFVPVQELSFLGAFFAVFIVGLVLEVWVLHRSAARRGG